MKLEFLLRVEKPAQDPIEAALELICLEQNKIRYDTKEKWCKFGVNYSEGQETDALDFLKKLKGRLAGQHRRRFGTSRAFTAVVQLELGEPVLYVFQDSY